MYNMQSLHASYFLRYESHSKLLIQMMPQVQMMNIKQLCKVLFSPKFSTIDQHHM